MPILMRNSLFGAVEMMAARVLFVLRIWQPLYLQYHKSDLFISMKKKNVRNERLERSELSETLDNHLGEPNLS
jgi:hypothetical protein